MWIAPLLAILFVLLTPHLSRGSALAVTAEGEASVPLEGRSSSEAKDKALGEALKSSLVNAALSLEPSLDEVVLDKLRSDDHLHYIISYRISYELPSPESYKIAVEAEVDSEKLKARLKEILGDAPKPRAKPFEPIRGKPTLTIKATTTGTPLAGIYANDLERELAIALIGRGFRVVREGGDIRILANISLKTQESITREGGRTFHTLAEVNIRAEDAHGSKVAEAYATGYEPSIESRISSEAIRRLVNQAGSEIAKRLSSWETRGAQGTRLVFLTFTGVRNFSEYSELESLLANSLLGVESIGKRVFKGNSVSFEVVLSQDPEEFARKVSARSLKNSSIRLESVTWDKATFTLVPKG